MNIKKQIALRLRTIRLERFIASLIYSWQRDRIERQYGKPKPSEPMQTPGQLQGLKKTDRGAWMQFERAAVQVEFLKSDFVRVTWEPGWLPVPYAIAKETWPEVKVTVEENRDKILISSSQLTAIVSGEGSIEFLDESGRSLRQELPPQRQGEQWTHGAKLRSRERIYGLGERAAPFNLRLQQGKKYRMWHYDAGGLYGPGMDPLYLCIPVYVGLHENGSYLIFYENSFDANFSFNDVATAEFQGGAIRYYFTAGNPRQLLANYSELTGGPPLPPRWVFGYHQSRWGYETEKAVRDTANGFEKYDLPLSAIHLDIDCKDNFRSFTIDPDRFPKLREFNREMEAKGVRIIAIVNPGVKRDRNNKLYREGVAQEVFSTLPNGEIIHAPVWPVMSAFPDFTHPLARHWWSRQYEYLLDLGVCGFWHDMNDPGVFTLWGDATLPTPTRHFMEGRGGDHREAHNLYGLLQARAGYEALRDYRPEQRPFIVSRSGWAGLQRYAWTWTGDIETSWAGLRQTVSTVLGLSLSGIPYTGPDIGGFKGNPNAELYLRWFQLSTFLPFCRTHSANNAKPRTPWTYGEPTSSCVRDLLRLRYGLIPYFYTLGWEAQETGIPPIRPLFWEEPDNSQLWDVEDAFFLGDALLVYPIVFAKARSRLAIVPRGYWYRLSDDSRLQGSRRLRLDVPLAEIAVFVKAGSILPMEAGKTLILHLYPPVEDRGEGRVYSDAGDGYGPWRLDGFEMRRTAEGLELNWHSQGTYPFAYQTVELHLHGMKLQQVWVDDREVRFGYPAPDTSPVKIAPGMVVCCDRFQRVRFLGRMD